MIFGHFFAQNMGKILSNFNSETICGILSPRRTFWTRNMKENLGNYLLTSHKFFKILSVVREPKKQFLWEKNDIFCYSHPMAPD